ncbi:MAG: phage tail tape measure protein [Candidatus Lokiarchaeota archaeon]|nr:phage tail tape measure protein [Candidatus Lokiarchaeota archaeon]
MTFELEKLVVNIKADLTALSNGLKIAEGEVKTFVGKVSNVSNELNKVGKTLGVIGVAASAAMGIATKVFADFEQSIANTGSVLGATKDQMGLLSSAAREMGATTVFTASQSANAMYYLASAGYDAQQTINALQGTLDLAAATQYDLASTTEQVVSAINSFGLEAQDASRVANVFSAIISSSQATMYRLGESMKYIAPVAAALGISIEQTTAALGLLYDRGIDASQAGTSLRMALLRLLNPTKEVEDTIESLGLTLADVDPETKDLIQIIKAFENTTMGAREAAEIFGARAVSAMLNLKSAGSEALSDLTEKITGTNKASEMAYIQVNTLSGSVKLLKSAIEELVISLAEGLGETLTVIINGLREVILGFNNLSPFVKSAIGYTAAFTGAVGILGGVALLTASKLAQLAVTVKAFNVSLTTSLGIVGGVVAIAGLLTTALFALGKATKDYSIENQINISNMKTQSEELENLTTKYESLERTLGRIKPGTETYSKALDELKKVKQRLIEINPSFIDSFDKERGTIEVNIEKIAEYNDELKENIVLLEKIELKKAQNEYDKLTNEIDKLQNKIDETKEKMSGFQDIRSPNLGLLISSEDRVVAAEKELNELIVKQKDLYEQRNKEAIKLGLVEPEESEVKTKRIDETAFETKKQNLKEEQEELARLKTMALTDEFEREMAMIDDWEAQKRAQYIKNAEMLAAIEEAAMIKREEKVKDYMNREAELEEQRIQKIKRTREMAKRLEQEDYENRLRVTRAFSQAVIQSSQAIGEAFAGLALQAKDAWKDMAITIVRTFSNVVIGIISMKIKEYIALFQWVKAAIAAAQIAAVKGIETAAVGAIAGAQEGGIITGNTRRGQIVNVGENFTPEVILPLNKLPEVFNSMPGVGGGSSLEINVNMSGSLLSVNDDDAVDMFYKKVLLPAKKRLLREMQDVGSFEVVV